MQFGAKMWLTKNQRIPSLKLRGSVLFSLFNSLNHYTAGHFVILLMEKEHFFFFWWLDKTQRIFRVVEVLCMIPWWWIHVIKHLSKPRGYTTPRENPTVNCGLKVMVCQWRIIGCNTGTIWGRVFTMGGGCLQWGEGVCNGGVYGWGGQGVPETAWYLLFNFAMNLFKKVWTTVVRV